MPRASTVTWAPPPVSSTIFSAASSPAFTVCTAPSSLARASFLSPRLTAITLAPRAVQISTAARPTPPQPKIATHSPGFTAPWWATPWKDAEALLESHQTRRQVRAAIERLPGTYRNVLLLRDIEELDTAEVAEILGLTQNAVKTRLHRARVALRNQLDPILKENVA